LIILFRTFHRIRLQSKAARGWTKVAILRVAKKWIGVNRIVAGGRDDCVTLQKEKIAGNKVVGCMVHKEQVASRPRNDVVQQSIAFGGHVLYPLFLLITATSIADKNARSLCIDDCIVGYQALASGLVMTALLPGHAKIQTDPRSVTVHNDIVFDNVTRAAKPNTTASFKKTISLNYAILAASHNKLAIALIEYISAISVSCAFVADDLSFAIASIKYVFLNNGAHHNVSIRWLVRPDLYRLPTISACPGNILKMVISNDISSRHAVFVYSIIHRQVYATRRDIRKTTVSNVIVSSAWHNSYRRSCPTAILKHAIYDPAMIGASEFHEIPLKIAFRESKTVYGYVASSNRKSATSREDHSAGTLRSNRHGLLRRSLAVQIGGPAVVSSVGDYNGIARPGSPNGL